VHRVTRQAPDDSRLLALLALAAKARTWECWDTLADLTARIAEEAARLESEAA